MNYDFSMTDTDAGFPIHPKGQYEFVIGAPKAYIRTKRNGEETYGIRFPLKIKLPLELEGKPASYQATMTTDGAKGYAKQFAMAAYGFNPKDRTQEEEFNAIAAGLNWGYNPKEGTVEEGWASLEGKHIVGNLSIVMNNETQDEMQRYESWVPVQLAQVSGAE